jgi:HEAT repeat protein
LKVQVIMPKDETKNSTTTQQIIEALLNTQKPFSPKYLHRFSDITPEFLAELKKVWPQVSADRRANLLSDLEELAEADTLVCFDDISRFALKDSDPRPRAAAIRLLWECNDPKLIPSFLDMAENDPDEVVRASACSALGLFVYLGELEEIPENLYHKLENTLLKIAKGKDAPLVRRRALESLGYSGREEVSDLIKDAYNHKDHQWISSSLFAMGRSANEQWAKSVLRVMSSDDKDIQFEAIRAAGELELSEARDPLLEILEEANDLDEDIRLATIWSLSQIGGQGVREALEAILENIDDDEEAESIENALDNLSFTDGGGFFEMIDLEIDENDIDESDSPLKKPKHPKHK